MSINRHAALDARCHLGRIVASGLGWPAPGRALRLPAIPPCTVHHVSCVPFCAPSQLACAAKGLGAPAMLTPGFLQRNAEWSLEADEQAEALLRAMLDA